MILRSSTRWSEAAACVAGASARQLRQWQRVDRVGTVHDMRFVFLDNDTKLLFCTAYDGDWDPYIDDFATKIPDILDLHFSDCRRLAGIRSPKVKDFIAKLTRFRRTSGTSPIRI